jgi:pimeloyl-ACP methyl ester carboxylesterase
MPRVTIGDHDHLYYEVHGRGDPLLLVEGLGYATWMWNWQLPALAARYQTIIFDNRGVGDSSKPDVPYSIEAMAEDAIRVLQAVGVEKAHILGVSMGGYIAQVLAATRPELAATLLLCSTSCGGPSATPAPPETWQAILAARTLPPRESLRCSMEPAFAPGFAETHAALVEQIIDWRLDKPTPAHAWERQFQAVVAANLERYATSLRCPTLIVTGDADRVVPAANSQLLHRLIPHAELEIIPGGGHLVFIEQAERVNQILLQFLQRHPLS